MPRIPSPRQLKAFSANWLKGAESRNWKGGKRINDQGYVQIINGGGPNRHVREHIVIAERVLGRALPPLAVVHHVNGDRTDNRPCNLVVLESHAEHVELHRKMKVKDAGGNPHTDRICSDCGPQSASMFRSYRSSAVAGGYRFMTRCMNCFRIYDRNYKQSRRRMA